MEFWITQTFNGVSYGALLFLLAGGLSLIFGMMRIVNMTHGSYYLLGGYVALSVIWRGGPFLLALLAGAAAIALIGIAEWNAFLKRLSGQEKYEYTVMDPSAWFNRIESGTSIATHMAEMSMPMIRGVNDVEAGLFRVMEWLATDPGSGKPGMYVFENCVNTMMEFEKYSWLQPKLETAAQRMKVADRHSHALDALRYLVMSRPKRYISEKELDPRSFRALREKIKRFGRRRNVIGASDPPSVISY
jgi:hypothetical protein